MASAANFSADSELAGQIFALAGKLLPSSREVFEAALAELLPNLDDTESIKRNFSALVFDVQVRAYEKYLEAEGKAVAAALQELIEPRLRGHSAAEVFAFIREHPFVLDRLYLSLTQSRRTRAGRTFELVVTTLFQALSYPYTAQPELAGSKPDYVLPSLEHYEEYATDCILFTCKRTLRERWRQVVTEGATGQAFYLATIDDRLSQPELARMQQNHVIVVVPAEIKNDRYADRRNVVSFEDFFEHHLDPAVKRWQASGAI